MASAPARSARVGLLVAGVVGPAVFVADWAVLGATSSGYSPLDDAISRLARSGVSTRPAMTAGFIVYAAGLLALAGSDDTGMGVVPRALTAGTGLATLGVAAFPLDAAGHGTVHATFAGIGYATLAAAPLVAARAEGRPLLHLGLGVTAAGFLVASTMAPVHGLWQRVGLTVGDAWVVGMAIRGLRRRRAGD